MDRVNEVTRDVLQGIIQMRHLEPNGAPQPELLHQRMRAFAERTMHKAAELGYSPGDVQDITYALVALVDEVAVAQPGALRDFWLPRTLQLTLFNENVAGENFFQRLAVIMGDPARAEVLRVYYLCLLLGFQGKYRVRGGEVELASTTERVAAALRMSGVSTTLSPDGDRPKEKSRSRRGALPVVGVSVGAVALSFVLYGVLRFSLSSSTTELTSRIASLISG